MINVNYDFIIINQTSANVMQHIYDVIFLNIHGKPIKYAFYLPTGREFKT